MNKQDWALKLIGPHTLHDKKVGPVINFPRTVKLLKAEHARAIRLVKAEMKRVKLSAHQYSVHEKAYILVSLDNVLLALQRGRGGKG